MSRYVMGALALAVMTGCGDLKFDENMPTSPGGLPPGATTTLGAMTAIVDNVPFSAPLQTPAIWRNENFGFSAANASGGNRTFALSLRLPGPGTYYVGGTYSPAVTILEQDANGLLRWTTAGRLGAGYVTVSYIANESAAGDFSLELVPDSATRAAGYTTNRFVTNGSFNVSVQR
jgi:hypothetical protein